LVKIVANASLKHLKVEIYEKLSWLFFSAKWKVFRLYHIQNIHVTF